MLNSSSARRFRTSTISCSAPIRSTQRPPRCAMLKRTSRRSEHASFRKAACKNAQPRNGDAGYAWKRTAAGRMIGAAALHASRGEVGSAITTAILLIVATFVAHVRWKVNPILCDSLPDSHGSRVVSHGLLRRRPAGRPFESLFVARQIGRARSRYPTSSTEAKRPGRAPVLSALCQAA